jgi:hypothetical protein
MAAWRRKALKRFPELRRDLNAPDYSIYQLFFDLLPMVREGHRDHNCEVLRRIYGFADWCIQQKTKEPLNAAVVAFYEHLFDEPCLWDDITQWLTPLAIEGCLPCWEARLRPRQFGRLQKLLKGRRRIRYHEYT